ncbi:arsenate reductase family protein [Modicisalibacter xianhensis]|uniref:Arsenate reductase n=1 Tax=Modicisalibacter xianhensis TaxID=442341 RepID=A0A1I3CE63_9GAMM|nr:arsenate reductase family protein [Halomonas xianhensis]SFH72509.1 arsenate reductase [Halomonas xianhensis]
MAALMLYHNPRCSKSREALALLEARGVDFQVRRYLDEPLDREELKALASRLDTPCDSLVRTNEAEWKAFQVTEPDEAACLAAIAEYPRLLQRPILDRGDRAVIGRPPEAILTLLDSE